MSGAGSGSNPRAHTRGESVAYPRRQSSISAKQGPIPSFSSPTKYRTAPGNSANPAAALDSLAVRRNRALGLKLLAGLVIGGLIIYLGGGALNGWQTDALIKERKARRAHGEGESWVLPKRWLEHDAGELIIGNREVLHECQRVLLFEFTGERGFSSEINLYLQAQVIAQKLGYTLLADDSNWNYGALSHYFQPKQVHCRPPKDWFLRSAAVAMGDRRWSTSERVWFSRDLLDKADAWIRDEMLDPNAVNELRDRRFGHILPQGETLPGALEEVFVDFAAAAKELWRPNGRLASMIRKQRMELGLGAGGVRNRKQSPTFGGNRRKGDSSQRQPVEEVADDQLDFDEAGGAERSDRGPLIGIHVRLGDKAAEWNKDAAELGITRQTFGNLTVFLEAASDATRRLSKSTSSEPGYSRARTTLFPASAVATLVVMSAESSALQKILDDDLADAFEIVEASSPTTESLQQWKHVLQLESNDVYEAEDEEEGTAKTEEAKSEASTILTTFTQANFNTLPLSLRIHLTRYFLRDLTTLSLYADAFLISGASNVGRLACLIAGEHAVVGPRQISGKSLGGRVRSVDGYWRPTGRLDALFPPPLA